MLALTAHKSFGEPKKGKANGMRNGHTVINASTCCLLLVFCGTSTITARAASAENQTTGPDRGALVIVGGGDPGPAVLGRFLALAGGPDSPILVVPTANQREPQGADTKGVKILQAAGAKNLAILHTRSRKEADSEQFVKPLQAARGVWIEGGRQWRLADVYLGTRTEKELHALLARSGVIGGSSAGASIQASYLVRGAPEGNGIMMAKGHEQGFGFLRNSAIDQHVSTRHRENDMPLVTQRHPALLGIGLDEGTAIIVSGEHLEVLGKGKVFFHDARRLAAGAPPLQLSAGGRFNLRTRQPE